MIMSPMACDLVKVDIFTASFSVLCSEFHVPKEKKLVRLYTKTIWITSIRH